MPGKHDYAMKTPLLRFLIIMLAVSVSSPLVAQVLEIDQFKVTVFGQASTNPPTTPEVYYFGNRLNSNPDFGISLPMVFPPSTNGADYIMNQSGPFSFGYGSPVYTNKTDFDADFPNGDYDYAFNYQDINTNNVADNIHVVTSLTDLYSSVVPAYTPDCFTAMQNVDPAVDFTLSWNSYSAEPGTDYARTFIGSYDNATFNSQFGGYNTDVPPAQTSVVIPAGSLRYGRSYTILLYFSNRQTPTFPNDDGSTGSVTIGFDNQVHANLITLAPLLSIASDGGGNVILSWPTLASSYKLQTTPMLPAFPSDWNDVTNTPTDLSGTNSLALPASDESAFFRLAPQ